MDYTIFEGLTKSDIVTKFVELNPQPLPEKCPRAIMKYPGIQSGKPVTFLYDMMYGLKFTDSHPEYTERFNSRRNILNNFIELNPIGPNYFYYACYTNNIPELNMLEVSRIKIKGGRANRSANDDARTWEYMSEPTATTRWYISRVFVFKNDPVVYSANGDKLWTDNATKFYNKTFIGYINDFRKYIICGANIKDIRMFATGSEDKPDHPKYSNLEYPYNWSDYFKVAIPRKVSKEAIAKDALMNTASTDDPKDIYKAYAYKLNGRGDILSNIIVYEKVDDHTLMFRYFGGSIANVDRDKYYSMPAGCEDTYNFTALNESYRALVDLKKNKVSYLEKDIDMWKTKRGYKSTYVTYVANRLDIQKDFPGFYDKLIKNQKHPNFISGDDLNNTLEEIKHFTVASYKDQYPNIHKYIFEYSSSIKEGMRSAFLVFKEPTKGENIFTTTGCNKYQLDKVEDALLTISSGPYSHNLKDEKYLESLKAVKMIFGDDISKMTNSDFDYHMNQNKKLVNLTRWTTRWPIEMVINRDIGYWLPVEDQKTTNEDRLDMKVQYDCLLRIEKLTGMSIESEYETIKRIAYIIKKARRYYPEASSKIKCLSDREIFNRINSHGDLVKLLEECEAAQSKL